MVSFGLARVTSAQQFDRMNHVFYFFLAHARKKREADKAAPGLGRHRAIFRQPSERFLIIGMQMQRPPMHGTAYAGLRQLLDEFIAVDRQSRQSEPDREQVPGMDPITVPQG